MKANVIGLRTRLGLTTVADPVLQVLLDDTVAAIRTLTGFATIPDLLDYFVYQVAVDAYRSCGYGSASAPPIIASVQDGQQKVSFATGGVETRSGSASITNLILNNHAAVLQRVRRLRW